MAREFILKPQAPRDSINSATLACAPNAQCPTAGGSAGATQRPMEESDIRQQLEAGQYSAAFERLVERFKVSVFRLAFSILRNQTHAEDAAQDVFVKIWKGLPAYHGGASLSTWIYAITRNTCLTELKRRRRHPTVSLQAPEREAAADCIPALQSADAAPGGQMDVELLLARLPEKYRQVIAAGESEHAPQARKYLKRPYEQ